MPANVWHRRFSTAALFQSIKASLEIGAHSFQLLLKLLILNLELLNSGGKFGKLLLKTA